MGSETIFSLADSVRQRITAVRQHLATLLNHRGGRFDVFHAHDGIGGSALADLAEQGLIDGHLRTVHHVDRFADPQLQAWEERSIHAARQVLCVSALWCERLQAVHRIAAQEVPNGVDLARFTPQPSPDDERITRRLGINRPGRPVILTVGGIEARKNTHRLLQAFLLLRERLPTAQLIVAGGASVLDHQDETHAFQAEAAAAGLPISCGTGPGHPIVITGPLPDADLPALYRAADVLAMPSLIEGFGLAALEGLASGAPAVVSQIAPFTEHFTEGDVVWADPLAPASIADALLRAVAKGRHADAPAVCHRFAWAASAARHETLYQRLTETA